MFLSLLCDEHIPYPVIKGLQRRGIDVISVQEIELYSEKDETVIDKAKEEGRIIYTQDADFLRLHSKGYSHIGIIYHHPRAYSLGEAIRRVEIVCKILSYEKIKGNIKFL